MTVTGYSQHTTANEVATTFAAQIRGKVILITGPTIGGIGFEAAITIASKSPKLIILAGRSQEKLNAAEAEIHAKYPDVQIRKLLLDLTSLGSVRTAAKEVLTYPEDLDIVIANAAVMAIPEYTTTKDGFEMQFGTNHLGHFVFVNEIMPKILTGTGEKRIVNVTSIAHEFTGIRFDDVNFGNGAVYDKWQAYGQSKTANILFAKALADMFGPRGLKAYSLHPGSITTGLQKFVPEEELTQMREIYAKGIYHKSLQEGSATTLVAAFATNIADKSGAYLRDADIAEPAQHAQGSELAEKLWNLSESLVGAKYEF
ncbi:short-chain dehydrogenase [Sphaerosporella brunnea]|uniref:Short-chain dehydrogenase n=1 Tax=Sphaerosporella brunnea TaxID=1250544 RepID=A0A5J5EPB2_9PEZI|nr:short-chain dehydrogenase [Sphaerosporella brunnea]